MKLRRSKANKEQPTGRRRLVTERQAPQAFSYHSQRLQRETGSRQAAEERPKRDARQPHFWWRRGGLIIVLLVAVVCAASLASLSTSARIILAGNGNSYLLKDTPIYQRAADQKLSSSIWNRNKITIDTGGVAATLRQRFPELASVTVALPLVGHRPIVYLTPATPAFILNAVNGSFVLSADGRALMPEAAMPAQAARSLTTVTDQTGLRARVGQAALNANDASFIQTVIAELQAKHVAIAALDLPAGAAEELDVHLANAPYYVKFNMHDTTGARQQAGTFLATQAHLKQQNITPSQYIDVRVQGRAYYK